MLVAVVRSKLVARRWSRSNLTVGWRWLDLVAAWSRPWSNPSQVAAAGCRSSRPAAQPTLESAILIYCLLLLLLLLLCLLQLLLLLMIGETRDMLLLLLLLLLCCRCCPAKSNLCLMRHIYLKMTNFNRWVDMGTRVSSMIWYCWKLVELVLGLEWQTGWKKRSPWCDCWCSLSWFLALLLLLLLLSGWRWRSPAKTISYRSLGARWALTSSCLRSSGTQAGASGRFNVRPTIFVIFVIFGIFRVFGIFEIWGFFGFSEFSGFKIWGIFWIFVIFGIFAGRCIAMCGNGG